MTDSGRSIPARRDADPYKILQVDPEADPDVIQAAYRRLAQKYHPDVAPGSDAAARMVAINAAWEILRDPASRAAFDRSRTAGDAGAAATRPAGAAANQPLDVSRPVGRHPPAAAGTTDGHGPAGPPPGHPSGSVLIFGRYAGWSLGEIARRDLEYIEWLDRMPIGRPYRDQIDAILRRAGRRRVPDGHHGSDGPRRGLFRRR